MINDGTVLEIFNGWSLIYTWFGEGEVHLLGFMQMSPQRKAAIHDQSSLGLKYNPYPVLL
jgi:hypothetical protein